jgi:hypothetical protein
MNKLIISTLIGLSVVATGTLSASADDFAVHGYQGTHYGR